MTCAVVGTTVPKNAANNHSDINNFVSFYTHLNHRTCSTPTALAVHRKKVIQGWLVRRSRRLEAHARRSSVHSSDEEWVTFDGEDEWNERNTSLRPSANAFIPQAMKALSLVTDKLTDIALQFAPEDASPGTVRTAVVGSMLLVALSFVKGILSFILTIGTIIFGAFVAVRIFGLEVGSGDEIDLRKSNKRQIRTRRSSRQSSSEGRRPRLPFGGPLADLSDEDEDASGLMDVWFEVSRKSEPNPVSKKKPGKRRAGDGKGSRTRQA